MKKSLAWAALPLAIGLVRCDCGTDLTEVPSPKIQAENNQTGASSDDGELLFAFADLTPGQNATQQVTVRNQGTAQLIFESYGLRADLQDPRCPAPSSEFEVQPPAGPLNPGEEVGLSIAYAPRDGGQDCAVVQILSNDPSKPELRLYLEGRGSAAKLCASAAQVDFGEVPIGTHPTQDVELSNCGTKELTLQALTQQQGFPPFSLDDGPALPSSALQPGDSVTLTFGFESATPGDFTNPSSTAGLVQIDTVGPINPQSFLVLTAVAVTPPTCDLVVVPTSLQFGHVRPGDDRSYDVSVVNQGRLDCEIQSLNQVDGSADFSITQGDAPPARTLAPNASELLTFRFAPTSSAVLNATFRLSSDDPDEPSIDIHLEGDGSTPSGCVIEADPLTLNFGSSSTTQISELTVSLVNIGDETCRVSETSISSGAPDFFVGEVGFPLIGAIVNAGASLDVPVGFQPRSVGAHTGTLGIQYAKMGFGNPTLNAQVELRGSGSAPAICIEPEVLDFGQVTAGSHPCADIVVSNCGQTDLSLRGVVMQAGSSDAFELTAPAGLPGALQPGQSINVHVCYRPDGAGADFGAVEIISDDPDDNTSRVVLRGNSAGMCPPFLACEPQPLDMGDIASDTAATRTVVCTNYGGEIITISGAVVDPSPIFRVSAQTPTILSPGDQLALQVTFGPGYVGAFTGTVTVSSNACDSTILIDVSAAGVEPDLPPCTPPNSFSPETLWTWDSSTVESAATQVWVTPLVANMNDDNMDGLIDVNDIPDVIFNSFDREEFNQNTDMQNENGDHVNDPIRAYLRIVSGDDGRELVSVSGETYALDSETNMAVADIDGDNKPEVVGVKWFVLPGTESVSGGPKLDGKFKYGYLMAFENDGTFKWQSEQWIGNENNLENSGAVSIADIDHDGFPEIIFGNNVFDHNGHLLWTGSAGAADSGHGPQSYAVNLDNQGDLEIVCGRTVYRSDGSILWDRDDLYDGNPMVVDLNGDGSPELVLRNDKLHILNALTGATIAGPYEIPNPNPEDPDNPGVIPTIPAAADFDNDGLPEIVVANQSALVVYEMDGTILWQREIWDGSGMAGPAAFDFEGDGIYEVVYADEAHAFAYRGTDGLEIYRADRSSLTISEIATVADINDDDQAEMVVVFNEPKFGSAKGVKAFTNSEGAWTSTRRIYNQQAYHVTNIDESGIVPRDEPPNWLQGVDSNSFHTNIPRCAP